MRVAKALIIDDMNRVLVLRRSGTHPRFAYESDLPGGIIEDGESYEEGLARELREEVAVTINPDQFVLAAERKGVGLTPKRLYMARVTARPDITLSWEHDRFEWLPYDELSNIKARDTYMQFVAKYVVDHPL